RWTGRRVPSHERPVVRVGEEAREVTGRCQTSLVTGEVDRPSRGRDEGLGAVRSGHRVRRAGDEAGGDPDAETSEDDLSACAVGRRARGAAEGALESIP